MFTSSGIWGGLTPCRRRGPFSLVLFLVTCILLGDPPDPAQGQQYAKSVDPYEVIVYEHRDFTGYYQSFKLDPSKRQKLVPFLDKSIDGKIFSIQVGDKVGVVLFNHPKFQDFRLTTASIGQLMRLCHEKSAPDLKPEVSSLLVYQRELGPMGIVLMNKPISFSSDRNTRFYPLMEDWTETKVCYKSLQDLDGESEFVTLFPANLNSPAYGKVFVTLFDKANCQGKWLTLPGAGGYSTDFELNKYDWDEKAHSLEVRWEGQIPAVLVQGQIAGVAKVPESKAHARAPAAPTEARAPAASDLEKGFDRPGSDYKNFPLDGGPEECQQACTSDPNCKAFTWVQPGVQGPKARCWLKSGVPGAVANANCISGVKTALAAGQMSSSTSAPSQTSAVDIGGIWKSSIGLVYDIRQRGEQFGWTVANSDEKGRGTCQGKTVSATWSGSTGSGSAKGNIVGIDNSGKATRIEWDNGAVFFR
jgi:hypothetical protein